MLVWFVLAWFCMILFFIFFGTNIFRTKIVWDQNFFGMNIFWDNIFLNQIFWGTKLIRPSSRLTVSVPMSPSSIAQPQLVIIVWMLLLILLLVMLLLWFQLLFLIILSLDVVNKCLSGVLEFWRWDCVVWWGGMHCHLCQKPTTTVEVEVRLRLSWGCDKYFHRSAVSVVCIPLYEHEKNSEQAGAELCRAQTPHSLG